MKAFAKNFAICFWLAMILLFPLRGSLWHDPIPTWLFATGNTLKISFPWRFFSPEPATPMSFEYTLYGAGGSQEELARETFPDPKLRFFNMEFFYRNSYWVRNTTVTDEATRDLFAPFLCRTVAGAKTVMMRRLVADHPSLAKTEIVGDVESARAHDESPTMAFECPAEVAR